MASLDLVVTVDTAIAHLAGALGRPVHLLLAHPEADWRWLARPHDTVWYPSMRLYRQSAAGAWSGPVSRCARDIRVLLGQEAADDQPLLAPVSAGELLDKITILGLKRERIQGDARRANVLRELSLLGDVRSIRGLTGPAVDAQFEELRAVNETLWEIEDRLREHEGRGDFGPEFVDLARRVYLTNDRRALIKKAIDRLTSSAITEEKSYAG